MQPDNAPRRQPDESALLAAWRRLAAPLGPSLGAAGRRKRLLAWLLISLLLLSLALVVVVLLPSSAANPNHGEYLALILGLDAFLLIAYGLNMTGRYSAAAALTVGCAGVGPWGALWISPRVPEADLVALAYGTLSIVLCSILLPPVVTALLAAVQLIGFALVAWFHPTTSSLSWPSLLALLMFGSVLSILLSVINQSNMQELERQTRALEEREAALRELSVRDHLTELFNRRYLEESLEREIRRSERGQRSIGIILFDIDDFKRINDSQGHAAGDEVLRSIGKLAREVIRGGDIACRQGGDEFVLVLPETSHQTARQRAEGLLASIRNLNMEYHGHALGPVTISAGIAVYPQHGDTGEELLHAADQALYRAKQDGKDRISLAEL
ncbi:MAG TPA: GGDEF domain-containing protein [Anaerolineales bacterium]